MIYDSSETVEARIMRGEITPASSASVGDLFTAIEVLLGYEGSDEDDNVQSIANVVALLERQVGTKRRRQALTEAKREVARERGVPVSSLRVSR